MLNLPAVHFTHNYLLQPTNPVVVNIIGAGGTGSQMLTALARMHHSLLALGHPGLMIQLYDDDKVTSANLGRQLFATCDIGQYKAIVLINRVNRFIGSGFKAIPCKYDKKNLHRLPQQGAANITITCVDTVAARFEVAEILHSMATKGVNDLYRPLYWLDMGNSQHTGQVILSTIGEIKQPASKKYFPVGNLPFITAQFKALLKQATEDTTPSCSLAEALTKQDLYINSTLANMAASLLWSLFREGMTTHRGCFLHLKDFRMQPLKVA
ncbi:MAG: PRTRC system ThiF family protein [Niabella sp.]